MKHNGLNFVKICTWVLMFTFSAIILLSCQDINSENNLSFLPEHTGSISNIQFLPEHTDYFGASVVYDGKLYISDAIQQPICYIDRTTMKLETLCRQSNCTHNYKNCLSDPDFYIPSSYQILEGFLYTHGRKYDATTNDYITGIYKIDGEQLTPIIEWERDFDYNSRYFDYENSYFYFIMEYGKIWNDLYRFKSDRNDDIEMVSGEFQRHSFNNIKINGDYIYYTDLDENKINSLYRANLSDFSKRERITENIVNYYLYEYGENSLIFFMCVDLYETGQSTLYYAHLSDLNKKNKIISNMYFSMPIFYQNICVYISSEKNEIIYFDLKKNKQLRKIKIEKYAPNFIYYADDSIVVCYDKDSNYAIFYYNLDNPDVQIEVLKQ